PRFVIFDRFRTVWALSRGRGAAGRPPRTRESGRYLLVGRRGVSRTVRAQDGLDELVQRSVDAGTTVVEVVVDLEYPVPPLAGRAQLRDPFAVVKSAGRGAGQRVVIGQAQRDGAVMQDRLRRLGSPAEPVGPQRLGGHDMDHPRAGPQA